MKNFVSDISRAKHLGSAKSGVSHWMWQRLTAIFLVPLYVWFVLTMFQFFINPEYVTNQVLYSPFSLIALLLMVNITLIHGVLGIKVVLEDYVHSECLKNFLIIISYGATLFTMMLVSLSLLLNFIVNI